jgi:hypothetical protein
MGHFAAPRLSVAAWARTSIYRIGCCGHAAPAVRAMAGRPGGHSPVSCWTVQHRFSFLENIADGRVVIVHRSPRDVAGWSTVGGAPDARWARLEARWCVFASGRLPDPCQDAPLAPLGSDGLAGLECGSCASGNRCCFNRPSADTGTTPGRAARGRGQSGTE